MEGRPVHLPLPLLHRRRSKRRPQLLKDTLLPTVDLPSPHPKLRLPLIRTSLSCSKLGLEESHDLIERIDRHHHRRHRLIECLAVVLVAFLWREKGGRGEQGVVERDGWGEHCQNPSNFQILLELDF